MEMFKAQNESSPAIMSRVFPITEQNYILRNNFNFVSRRVNTVHYGSEFLSHLGPKLWRILPDEHKNVSVLTNLSIRSKRGCLTIAPAVYVKDVCNMLDLFNVYQQVGGWES